ncbi:glycosyltransferase family 4 protein [Chrysiogenes arsenatis]|uniref:glycosyltransferase family 4 protein n=1 Tax=Chrysiogenes arsenatis TaxID=309797 RepID=UPI0004186B47|nr:glycosyltransferase family 1 protein [Chrysiogenes arsenatis]
MKIAFNYPIFTYQQYGGISRYYKILAEQLSEMGNDVSIISGIHQNSYLASMSNRNIVKGWHVKKYPPRTTRIFKSLNAAYTSMKLLQIVPDVVHETYYTPSSLMKAKQPRTTTVYDMIHELFPDQFSCKDKTTIYKQETFRRVQHILSISHSTKRDLINCFGIDENNISVVHLGVDAAYLQYAARQESNNILLPQPYLLYVGGRTGYKNFFNFLKAVSLSSRLITDFNIVAFGGGAFTRQELIDIKNLGLSEQQITCVSGSDALLAQYYANAVAFIYPSLYEGFGLPPLEAMACNCPVISSNSSSMPEVIGNAGEFFDPNSLEEMMHAMESVLYDSTRRSALLQLGTERVKQFTWEKCAYETLKIYQNITR